MLKLLHVFHRELLLNNNQLRVLPFELGKLFQLQTLGLKGERLKFFVAFLSRRSSSWAGNDFASFAILSPGNPLAQEIMSLYQEPDGTRRLLNYLLDNLAGAIKRSEFYLLLAVLRTYRN